MEPWCIGPMTGSARWHREEGRSQSAVPYEPLRPLIGGDERPCVLIGEGGAILPMSPGKARCHHDASEKNGACWVLLAFAPPTGLRSVAGRQPRTAVDSAPLMHHLIAQHSPAVEPIRRGRDHLKPHTGGAFAAVVPPEEACALSQKLARPSPPKQGSWFNMAESAFAARSPQGRDRRIANMDLLGQEVLAWAAKRKQDHKTVHWRFAQTDARTKMKRH